MKQSILESGLLNPIVVNQDNVILSGHRRYFACKELCIGEIPVEVKAFGHKWQELEYLLLQNRYRAKTNIQMTKEYDRYLEVERERAKERQLSFLKQNQATVSENFHERTESSTGGASPQLCENFHEAEKGRSVDMAAQNANAGKSGRTMETWSDTLAEISRLPDDERKVAETVFNISPPKAKNIIESGLLSAITPEIKNQIANNDISVIEALKSAAEINAPNHGKPHIAQNSGNNEWYTPSEYIEAARKVMGAIDLDPASCETANKTVKADTYYTAEDDGLTKKWYGRVWLNPPYAGELICRFIDKLKSHVLDGDIQEAIALVNNATETAWFNNLISAATAAVFPNGRVKFYMADGTTGAPLQGQAVVYIGENADKFISEFGRFGWCAWLNAE